MRKRSHFILADISKAFVQIELDESDQWLLAFRWPVLHEDGTVTHKFFRFLRMPWGINCAPFLLNAALRFLYRGHAEQHPEDKDMMKELEDFSYVDDIAMTGNSPGEVMKLLETARGVLKKGKFELTKFKSFPPELVEGLGGTPSTAKTKVLGCGYNPESDSFFIRCAKLREFRNLKRITKRQAFGIVGRIFDPLGWGAPASLFAKALRQEFDRKHPKAPWNYKLTEAETKEWHNLVDSFENLPSFEIPRVMTVENEVSREFHVFCDASGLAIGSVLYCVSFSGTEGVPPKVTLLAAKNKINPIAKVKTKKKRPTQLSWTNIKTDQAFKVNRLELNAALLGVRLFQLYKPVLGSDSPVHFWTDSTVTLQWLSKMQKTGVTFVDNRVEEVLKVTKSSDWRHVPGEQNPADLATRGLSVPELLDSQMWKRGPDWLTTKEYPQQPILSGHRASFVPEHTCPLRACKRCALENPDVLSSHVLEPATSWRQAIRKMARIKRAKVWWKGRYKAFRVRFPRYRRPKEGTKWVRPTPREVEQQQKSDNPIFAQEQKEAELDILRHMQQKYAPEAWKMLAGSPDLIFEGLVWDEQLDLLMSRSRQNQFPGQDLPLGQRDLIFVPYDAIGPNKTRKFNRGLELLMTECHELTGHGSIAPTVAKFRTRFWCKNARKTANWVKKKCYICRRIDAKPFTAPEAPLPAIRYDGTGVFRGIGVDFVGPFTSDWTAEPFSILVVTCALTRAVLLKPVMGVGAQEFKSVFNTILNEYRIEPEVVVSDRAPTFRNTWACTIFKARKLLTQAFKDKGIQWNFNASRAPWWGGFYERFMRMIKDRMTRTFFKTRFHSFAALQEAVSFVQAAINSRPLTFDSADSDEPRPITPEMFLFLHSHHHYEGPWDYYTPAVRFEAGDKKTMKAHIWKRVLAFNNLWTSFQENYIAELRKWRETKATRSDPKIREGQVVLYKPQGLFKQKSTLSRLKWKLARVEKLHRGYGQHVRSVDISLYNPEKKTTYILESQTIQNLAPLEVDLAFDPRGEE
jgi:hypothetical protein